MALAAVAVVAAVLRALPLLPANAAQTSADFDEGVYLAAAALLSEGVVPYRDFVFLHPPGLLLLVAPLTLPAPALLPWGEVLVAARWLAVAVGTVNVVLLGAVAARWRGPVAGLVAAGLYAVHRPAVAVEQHVLLEPFVVLLVLLTALVWLSGPDRAGPLRSVGTGVLVAAAGLVKLTGGVVLLPVLLSVTGRRGNAQRVAVTATAGLTAAVVLAPFLVKAGPAALWSQLVVAQAQRPGGDVEGGSVSGTGARLVEAGRLGVLAADAVPTAAVVAVLLVVGAAAVREWLVGGPDGRFWATALVVLLGPPLLAPDWYQQYPVPSSVAVCALVGGSSAAVLARLGPRPRLGTAVRVAGVLVLLAGGLDAGRDAWRERPGPAPDFGAVAGRLVGPEDCLVADPPDLALAAGRLPVRDRSGSHLVDPFGAPLLAAIEDDEPGLTPALLDTPVAQARMREALASCRLVALRADPRQSARLSPETASWFLARFRPVPAATTRRATLWEAVPQGGLTAPAAPEPTPPAPRRPAPGPPGR